MYYYSVFVTQDQYFESWLIGPSVPYGLWLSVSFFQLSMCWLCIYIY